MNAQEVATRFVENFRFAKWSRSPFDELAWQALGRAVAERASLHPDGLTPAMANNSNYAGAQMATPSLDPTELASLTVPVLIVRGKGHPIFPI